jgi:hypothetical protein
MGHDPAFTVRQFGGFRDKDFRHALTPKSRISTALERKATRSGANFDPFQTAEWPGCIAGRAIPILQRTPLTPQVPLLSLNGR